MDGTTERLDRIEAALDRLTAIVRPMAEAWEKFGPTLEKRLNNPAARWKARNGSNP